MSIRYGCGYGYAYFCQPVWAVVVSVCVWVCELVHIPVQINASFGLLITVRARAINLITLSAPAPPRLAFPH